MNSHIIKRVLEETEYILKTEQTIREISEVFHVSKSTVHKDLHERLFDIDNDLFLKVHKILKYHMDIRHIRGGAATKLKYLKLS